MPTTPISFYHRYRQIPIAQRKQNLETISQEERVCLKKLFEDVHPRNKLQERRFDPSEQAQVESILKKLEQRSLSIGDKISLFVNRHFRKWLKVETIQAAFRRSDQAIVQQQNLKRKQEEHQLMQSLATRLQTLEQSNPHDPQVSELRAQLTQANGIENISKKAQTLQELRAQLEALEQPISTTPSSSSSREHLEITPPVAIDVQPLISQVHSGIADISVTPISPEQPWESIDQLISKMQQTVGLISQIEQGNTTGRSIKYLQTLKRPLEQCLEVIPSPSLTEQCADPQLPLTEKMDLLRDAQNAIRLTQFTLNTTFEDFKHQIQQE